MGLSPSSEAGACSQASCSCRGHAEPSPATAASAAPAMCSDRSRQPLLEPQTLATASGLPAAANATGAPSCPPGCRARGVGTSPLLLPLASLERGGGVACGVAIGLRAVMRPVAAAAADGGGDDHGSGIRDRARAADPVANGRASPAPAA